jgi:hypothetical protein
MTDSGRSAEHVEKFFFLRQIGIEHRVPASWSRASSVPYAEETKGVVLAPTMGAQMYRMGTKKGDGLTVKDDE